MGAAFGAVFIVLGLIQTRMASPRIDAELAERQSIAMIPFTDLREPKPRHLIMTPPPTSAGSGLMDIKVISRQSSAVLGNSADVQ